MISAFLDPYKCIPLDVVDHLSKVDLKAYQEKGFKTLLIDIDNTLIPYDDRAFKPWHETLKKDIKKYGFEVILVSNNSQAKIESFAQLFDAPFIHRAQKPSRKGFIKALKKINAQKETALIIGDQLMTDVYGANRLGVKSILVRPIHSKTEKWYTKITRRLENQMLKKVQKINPDMYEIILRVHRG
jgi:HAD superfamily phosphatase (TIGR01668 family)